MDPREVNLAPLPFPKMDTGCERDYRSRNYTPKF